jgi:hypothetical protein
MNSRWPFPSEWHGSLEIGGERGVKFSHDNAAGSMSHIAGSRDTKSGKVFSSIREGVQQMVEVTGRI